MIGVQRRDHLRGLEHVRHAHHAETHKPDQHDRAEQDRDLARPKGLRRIEADDDRDRDRQDVGLESRRRDLEALRGRKHRHGRRDDGVAIEQRRPDHAHGHEDPGSAAERFLRERHQRERAALAVVVGAQQDDDVFQRHHDDERPDQERGDADDLLGVRSVAEMGERLPHRVKRARADVAIDDADAADGEGPETLLTVLVMRHMRAVRSARAARACLSLRSRRFGRRRPRLLSLVRHRKPWAAAPEPGNAPARRALARNVICRPLGAAATARPHSRAASRSQGRPIRAPRHRCA